MSGIGDSIKQKFEINAAEPKYRMQPTIKTPMASLSVIIRLGNSRCFVLGFLKSNSRSIIRFKAKAAVRAPTAAIKTIVNNSIDGNSVEPRITPQYIRGSVKRVCSILTKLINFLKNKLSNCVFD